MNTSKTWWSRSERDAEKSRSTLRMVWRRRDVESVLESRSDWLDGGIAILLFFSILMYMSPLPPTKARCLPPPVILSLSAGSLNHSGSLASRPVSFV